MITCQNWPIGVCSWSANDNLETLADLRSELGLEHLHLNMTPAISDGGDEFLAAIAQQGWKITSTMIGFAQEDYSTLESIKATGGIVPDDCWEKNQKCFLDAIDVTAKLAVQYLSFHLGFIDESDAEQFAKLSGRLRTLADAAAAKGITLLLETGQECAADLRSFLEKLNHPAVAVNFDPANMILYGKGDPVEAVKTLAPWIKHIHIKDATPTETPGTWGAEVPWGIGQVGNDRFLNALNEIDYTGALAIERECGESRLDDVKQAIDCLTSYKA